MDNRSNLFFYYKKNKDLIKKLKPLFEYVESQGFQIVEESKDANIVISVGGDGEFLQAVRHTHFRQDCLYVGITQADELGLYCDFNIDQYDEIVDSMINDSIEVLSGN